MDIFNKTVAVGTCALIGIMIYAVANQDFSWWVIPFAVLFTMIFGSVLNVCYLNWRDDRFTAGARLAHPDAPWLWDIRWQHAEIPSKAAAGFWSALVIAVTLSIFTLIGVETVRQGLPKGNILTIIALVPAPFAWQFLRKTWRAWRALQFAAQATLTLQTRPARVGGHFNATFNVEDQIDLTDLRAQLVYNQTTTRDDGEYITITKATPRKITPDVKITQGSAQIQADIPHNCLPSMWADCDSSDGWDLLITLDDITLNYPVPVAGQAMDR